MVFRRQGGAALAFMAAGAAWFCVGTVYGMVSAMHLVSPEFFNNIPWLVFGRARPIHVNTVLYGFATTTLIGAGLYYVPALLKTNLFSQRLAWVSWFLWNVTILSGPVTFSAGITQGREYTEYIWVFDVTLMLSVLAVIFNLIMTIVNRREKTLYVAVWYFMATFLWTAGIYPIGNVMWHPATGAMSGLLDSVFLWFYGHNLPGLVLTPLAVGAAYYVIPRVTKTPLYSHTLSLVGFWLLVALYSHIGGHHLLQAPIPNWLKVMSVVDSVAMVLPVFVVLANLWLTSRGKGGLLLADPAGRFVISGTVWYLMVCVQGPFQSIPFIQRVTHFSNWTIGHSHIAILGFAGFIALGAMWHIVPLITGRRLYSTRLVNLQFGLVAFGLAGFLVVLSIAGLVQGSAWNNGETVYRVIPEIAPYMVLRAMFGVLILTGAFVGFYNFVQSVRRGEPIEGAAAGEDGP